MKFMTLTLALLGVMALSIISCKKEAKDSQDEISQDTMTKIANLGFSTQNVQKIEEGYLVEGDIVLTDANLNERPSSPTLRWKVSCRFSVL